MYLPLNTSSMCGGNTQVEQTSTHSFTLKKSSEWFRGKGKSSTKRRMGPEGRKRDKEQAIQLGGKAGKRQGRYETQPG